MKAVDGSSMGCCIWELCDFQSASLEDVFVKKKWLSTNANTEKGIDWLLRKFNTWGAIATWCDVVPERYDPPAFSGQEFYKYLKEEGYDVGQSKIVDNPSGSPKVRLYYWHFRTPRKKPSESVRRSTKTARGKKAKEKTTTARRWVTG